MVLETSARMARPATLIAPCGMNCGLCLAYQRKTSRCSGCRGDDQGKPKTRASCKIKLCANREGAAFCGRCPGFPCEPLSKMNRRYRAKYAMSMIENLLRLEAVGLEGFLKGERIKWACPGCGSTLCVHKDRCLACERRWR